MIPGQRMSTLTTAVQEVQVKGAHGVVLQGRWWRRTHSRGAMIIAHGFGEHGGTYRHIAEVLGPALDIDVIAVDLAATVGAPAAADSSGITAN